MPDRVEVSCQSLRDEGGMRGVNAYPKDLRAAHGYDNQGQSTDSLAFAFGCLSAAQCFHCREPGFSFGFCRNMERVLRRAKRRRSFGASAASESQIFCVGRFRGRADNAVVDRYVEYALSKLRAGLSFTAAMKKVASARFVVSAFHLSLRRGASDRWNSEGYDRVGIESVVLPLGK